MTFFLPEQALNQHIAILGKTGSGKTYCAKAIVEHILPRKIQVCILDPTGAWFGLRLAADGKARGHDVVLLGGKHADIPLAERSGEAVARLVAQQGASAVIDTTGFTVGQYTRWFIDFAGTLYTTIRDPLHLVIDEAHYFMPQGKSPDVDAGRMLHAGNRLMAGGRSLGIRGMLITQRPAKLHKDSLTCADTLIAMRMIAPQDRGAVREWIDGAGDQVKGKEVLDTLAQLQRGQGWVWYPEGGYLERVTFPRIKTYDSSATPTHGAKAGPKVTEIKLDEVRAAMADAVKEAEANDPKLLRAEIARLKAAKPVPAADQATIDRAVASAVAKRDREHAAAVKDRDRIIDLLKGRMGKGQTLAGQLASMLSVNGEATVGLARAPSISSAETGQAPARTLTDRRGSASSTADPAMSGVPRRRQHQEATGAGSRTESPALAQGQLSRMERSFLTALAQHPDGLTKRQLLTHTDYASSGPVSATFARMVRESWVDEPIQSSLRITAAGLAVLGPFEPLPKGAALRELRLSSPKLSPMEKAILGVLFGNYPHGITKREILGATGYASSGPVSATFAKFVRLGWAVQHGRSALKAADVFFEE